MKEVFWYCNQIFLSIIYFEFYADLIDLFVSFILSVYLIFKKNVSDAIAL